MKQFLSTFLMVLFVSCSNTHKGSGKEINVYLQPYDDFSIEETNLLQTDIQRCFDTLVPEIIVKVNVLEVDSLPKRFMNANRKRFRADSIIRNQHVHSGYILGLTHSDISCTVHGINDYGVLGLSVCPGHSAIISDYRVSNKSLFYKVGVHELLHCFGLPHCPCDDEKCYICDAHRKPKLDKQVYLCHTCKQKLLKRHVH